MSLVDIIEKNNLDIATDKNTLHNYVKGFYEKYFEPYKDAEVNLVEIGVWMGGSVKLWSEYFSNARSIIGIELNKNLYGISIKKLKTQHIILEMLIQERSVIE